MTSNGHCLCDYGQQLLRFGQQLLNILTPLQIISGLSKEEVLLYMYMCHALNMMCMRAAAATCSLQHCS